MACHAFPLVATLLATAASAQQFRIELQRDVLGQKPLRSVREPAAGDLDGDGRCDLVFPGPRLWSNRGASFVEIDLGLLGSANTFGPPTLVDIDGDGDLDVVQRGSTPGLVRLQLFANDGAGGLTDVTTTNMPAAFWTSGAAVPADVDGDGDQDLLLPSGHLFVNDGSGVFTNETATRVVTTGMSVGQTMAVADFDGDGHVDFAVMTGLHRNDGNGVFRHDATAGITFSYVEAIFVSDFDRDGDPDILTSTGRVLRNDGGVFTALADVALPGAAGAAIVAVADLDGDGADDLVVSLGSSSSATVAWVANDGHGGFLVDQPRGLPTRNRAIAAPLVADLDLDGDDDLVVTTASMSPRPALAEVLYNDGHGHWHNATELGGLETPRTYGRIAADLDGDGSQDIVAGGFVHHNDGSGSFTVAPFPTGGGPTVLRGAADFDSDGRVDLLGSRSVWLGAGPGQDMTEVPLWSGNEQVHDAAILDLDGDQDLDLLLIGAWGASSTVRMFRNDGSGGFAAVSAMEHGITQVGATAIAGGDFDGDGDADVVLGFTGFFGSGGTAIRLHANDGDGSFQEQVVATSPWSASRILVADFDGDGDLDFLVESSHVPVLFVNAGAGQFSTLALPWTMGNRFFPDDIDGDGDLDLWTLGSAAGWVRLFVNDGSNHFHEAPERVDQDRPGQYPAVDLVLVDFEGDGDRDVVVIAQDSATQTQFAVPLWNHARQLRAPHLTVTGGALDLFVSAGDVQPAASIAFLAVSSASVRIPLGDLGVLGVDPDAMLVLPVSLQRGGGTVHVPVAVPVQPSLQGMSLFAQALFCAPGQLRLSGTVTNTVLH